MEHDIYLYLFSCLENKIVTIQHTKKAHRIFCENSAKNAVNREQNLKPENKNNNYREDTYYG